MKFATILTTVALTVSGLSAQANIQKCDFLDGKYVITEDTTSIYKNLPNEPIMSTSQVAWELWSDQDSPRVLSISNNVLMGAEGTKYILDNRDHFISLDTDQSLPQPYYVRYQARCANGKISINQRGVHNDGDLRRVAQYSEQVLIEALGSKSITIKIIMSVENMTGETIYSAVNKQTLRRTN